MQKAESVGFLTGRTNLGCHVIKLEVRVFNVRGLGYWCEGMDLFNAKGLEYSTLGICVFHVRGSDGAVEV